MEALYQEDKVNRRSENVTRLYYDDGVIRYRYGTTVLCTVCSSRRAVGYDTDRASSARGEQICVVPPALRQFAASRHSRLRAMRLTRPPDALTGWRVGRELTVRR